jgi:hypothetical protein
VGWLRSYRRRDRFHRTDFGSETGNLPRDPPGVVGARRFLHALIPPEPGAIRCGEWTSQEKWNRAKRGYEWLFPPVGQLEDGQISSAEYKELQAFKQSNPDWEKKVRERLGGALL